MYTREDELAESGIGMSERTNKAKTKDTVAMARAQKDACEITTGDDRLYIILTRSRIQRHHPREEKGSMMGIERVPSNVSGGFGLRGIVRW